MRCHRQTQLPKKEGGCNFQPPLPETRVVLSPPKPARIHAAICTLSDRMIAKLPELSDLGEGEYRDASRHASELFYFFFCASCAPDLIPSEAEVFPTAGLSQAVIVSE